MKNLEAFLRGYIIFIVNRKIFFKYEVARKYRTKLSLDISMKKVSFKGFHILKGFRSFFLLVRN